MEPLSEQDLAKDKKIAYAVTGVWALLTLFFCCGGAGITGIAGADRESAGVDMAMLTAGPACCTLAGFLGAIPGLFAFRGKVGLKVGLPIALGVVGGLAGAVGMFVFFEAIWPSL